MGPQDEREKMKSDLPHGTKLYTHAERAIPALNIMCETVSDGITGTTSLNVVRVEPQDDGSFTAVTDYWPSAERARVSDEVVDWLIAYMARLIVDGMHPDDAKAWMQSHEMKDWEFDADPVACADTAFQDFFEQPEAVVPLLAGGVTGGRVDEGTAGQFVNESGYAFDATVDAILYRVHLSDGTLCTIGEHEFIPISNGAALAQSTQEEAS